MAFSFPFYKWTENFSFLILLHFPNNCVFSFTYTILHPFCSSLFCFSISPILSLLASFTLYIMQLFLSQKSLSLIFLCLCSLIIAFPTFYKDYYLLSHCPPLYAHNCSSRQQSFHSTMLLYLFPYFLWRCCLFSPFLVSFWTLPLLVPFLSTSKALPPFFHYFLLSHLFYPTLHHPAC